MTEKILELIKRESLIPRGARVIVALSGGADSVALLFALNALKSELDISLAAAHFNHKIRGAEAERDARFSKDFAEGLGVKFFNGSGDVPAFAAQNGLSLELAAREMRYDFLLNIDKTALIATAHTASDSLETAIFNLSRGTGLSGLCGIPPKRGRIIRPLLSCTREDIEGYCGENNLSFVTDSTNLSDDYTRNRIRHFIIPELKRINPAAEETYFRSSRSLCEDKNALEAMAEDFYKEHFSGDGLRLEGFSELSPAVAKRVLRFCLTNADIEPDFFHLGKLYDCALKMNGRLSLPKGQFAVIEGGILKITADAEPQAAEFSVEFCEETVNFSNSTSKIHNLLLNNTVDCDKIVGKPRVRARMAGDKMCLHRGGGTKSLKKLFTEYKIPLHLRKNLPVVCDDRGILWIYKIGAAHRAKATNKTKRILKIKVDEK